MNWYLDSVELLSGGFLCLIIAGIVGIATSKSVGRIISGIFAFAGLLAIIYSFAGPELRTLQFLIACALVITIGVLIIQGKGAGLAAKGLGGALVVVGAIAFLNSASNGIGFPLLGNDFAASVGSAFENLREVIGEMIDAAKEKDPQPRKRAPVKRP